jgi:hypothetical protein
MTDVHEAEVRDFVFIKPVTPTDHSRHPHSKAENSG